MAKTILQKHNATEQRRWNVLDISDGGRIPRGATVVGAELENFEHLEPVDHRKRPFPILNFTILVGSFRCTNEWVRKFIPPFV